MYGGHFDGVYATSTTVRSSFFYPEYLSERKVFVDVGVEAPPLCEIQYNCTARRRRTQKEPRQCGAGQKWREY